MNEPDFFALASVTDRYGFEGEENDPLLPALRALPGVMRDILTDRQREIVKMRYNEGLSQADIGRRLRIAPSVVSRHLAAARKKMARTMGALL